jgi:hypothetical protein
MNTQVPRCRSHSSCSVASDAGVSGDGVHPGPAETTPKTKVRRSRTGGLMSYGENLSTVKENRDLELLTKDLRRVRSGSKCDLSSGLRLVR